MAIESMIALGLATALLVGLAWLGMRTDIAQMMTINEESSPRNTLLLARLQASETRIFCAASDAVEWRTPPNIIITSVVSG